MAVAEIVTIGTELLLGEIHDTNSRFIARALRDIGVDLYRLTTVGDNIRRITATLQEALMRADVVISTGGLGPPVDDPTRQAVADTFNVVWFSNKNYGIRYSIDSSISTAPPLKITSARHIFR
jgi:molybdenum cofactor synthesis domain-containing protein